MSRAVKIDFVSDVVCPWCIIGWLKFETVMAHFSGRLEFRVQWHPFELNPDMPVEGLNRKMYRSMKFGSWARSQMLDAQTIAAAENDGITFRYDLMTTTPNTRLAHTLMILARRKHRGREVAEALFSAYFEQGKNIGDKAVLIELATAHGLEHEEVERYLSGDEGKAEVLAEEADAANTGLRSVPQFDIGGELISGAQSVERLEEALKGAIERQLGCSNGACTIG